MKYTIANDKVKIHKSCEEIIFADWCTITLEFDDVSRKRWKIGLVPYASFRSTSYDCFDFESFMIDGQLSQYILEVLDSTWAKDITYIVKEKEQKSNLFTPLRHFVFPLTEVIIEVLAADFTIEPVDYLTGKAKRLFITRTNHYLGYDKPHISPELVRILNLKEEELVIAYEGNMEWEGMVRKDETLDEDNQWYVDIIKELPPPSYERLCGRSEGFLNGFLSGQGSEKMVIAESMVKDGYDLHLVEKHTKISNKLLEFYNNFHKNK